MTLDAPPVELPGDRNCPLAK